MKLARVGNLGTEKPCIYQSGAYYDVSSLFSDFNESFFDTNGLADLAKLNPTDFPVISGRLGSCVACRANLIATLAR